MEEFEPFWQQLNNLEAAFGSVPCTDNRDDELGAQTFAFSTRLYLIAAKLLLIDYFLTYKPKKDAVHTLVEDGLLILAMIDTSISYGKFYCWPCSVLRSVAHREADVTFLDQKLAGIGDASGCGYTRTLVSNCKLRRTKLVLG